jgi:hypothetical protein
MIRPNQFVRDLQSIPDPTDPTGQKMIEVTDQYRYFMRLSYERMSKKDKRKMDRFNVVMKRRQSFGKWWEMIGVTIREGTQYHNDVVKNREFLTSHRIEKLKYLLDNQQSTGYLKNARTSKSTE